MRQVFLGLSREARTGERLGFEVTLGFGDADVEARALREGVALLDAPWEGLLEIRGTERREFLQAMLTQDIARLWPGLCVPAAQADRKGHVIADLWVLDDGDRFLVRVRRDLRTAFLEVLERHRITEDVVWAEIEPLRCVLLLGPDASLAMESLGIAVVEGQLEGGVLGGGALRGRLEVAEGRPETDEGEPDAPDAIFWMRVRETPDPGFLLAAPERLAQAVCALLLASAPAVTPVGWEAWNARRIEVGTAWVGLDGGRERLVPELLPQDRISYTKGCYLGQETIARVHHLGQMNWQLARLSIASTDPPESGAEIRTAAGDRAGWITSAEATAGSTLALAFVHRRHLGDPDLCLSDGVRLRRVGRIARQEMKADESA